MLYLLYQLQKLTTRGREKDKALTPARKKVKVFLLFFSSLSSGVHKNAANSKQTKDEDISDEEELTVFLQPSDSELVLKREKKTRKCFNWKILFLFTVSVMVVCAFFAAGFLVGHYTLRNNGNNNGPGGNNNGPGGNNKSICSHPPLLIISLDGFRADYLDRDLTPNIQSFASDGVQAAYMTPAYPSLTFPNHFTIVTGLHPESHGIVSNVFYSRTFQEPFYIGSNTSNDEKWWLGEPVWVTAQKSSLKTAVYFWPGSEVPIQGMYPNTYFPYNSSVPFTQRMETVYSWITQPDATRPQFMAAYISEPDHSGHQGGPDSTLVNNSLGVVDSAVSVLINKLKENNIYDCVNIIIVSDHGMATVNTSKVITLVPEILPEEYFEDVQYSIYGELAMLYVSEPDQIEEIYNVMKENASKLNAPIDIYLRDEVPRDFYAGQFNIDRYGDIIVIARISGYVKITDDMPSSFTAKGAHGYDNKDPLMRALFLAHGPHFKSRYKAGPVSNIDIYELMCHLLEIPAAANNGTYASIKNILK